MSAWMVLAGIVGAWIGMWLWRRRKGLGRSAKDDLLEGTAQAMSENYARAIAILSRAIEKDPSLSDAWLHRGIAYLESGQVEAALQDLGTCIRLAPEQALGYYNRALAWLEKGEEERALSDLEVARQLEPEDVEVHTWRGIVLSRRGEYEGALQAIEEAIRLGDTPRGYQNKAIILEEAGRLEEAIANWDKVLERDRRNVMALCRRGLLREKLGWREAAAQAGIVGVNAPDLILTALGRAPAGLVAVGMVGLTAAGFAAAATVPLWGAMLVTALVSMGIGALVDLFVDTDQLKQKVADGLSAWGGIFARVGEAVPDAVQGTGEAADK